MKLTLDKPIRTPLEIAQDGGKKVVRSGRTGETALKAWEKKYGSLDVPAYKRSGIKRRTGHEKFSEN